MARFSKLFETPDVEELKQAKDIDGLTGALSHRTDAIRLRAAEALGELGDPRPAGALVATALNENYQAVTQAAVSSLSILGQAAVEPLIAGLRGAPPKKIRAALISLLGELRDPRGLDVLVMALSNEDEKVRRAAASALGALKEQRALDALVASLQDSDWEVRRYCIQAVKVLGTRETVPALLVALNDANDYVRVEASDALKALRERLGSLLPEDPYGGRVNRLVEVYWAWPQGLVRGRGLEVEREVIRIGRELYEQGGMDLMLAVHTEFARRCGLVGAGRNLEMMWDGIGPWRG